jgi:GDP-4-dehydro-6-deoxy-D-mannose reductase
MPPHDEETMHRVNVDGSVNLANALASAGQSRVRLISAGSAAEYLPAEERLTESSATGGSNAYGRTKATQSSALLQLAKDALDVVVARPFNLLGPGLSTNLVAGAACEQFHTVGRARGYIAPRGPIKSVRDFIDVRDVASAYWTLADRGESGEAYNVCTGEGMSIAAVIAMLEEEFGFRVATRPDYDATRIDADTVIGDNAKLLALGWRPEISVRRSLHDMVTAMGNA